MTPITIDNHEYWVPRNVRVGTILIPVGLIVRDNYLVDTVDKLTSVIGVALL